MRIVAGEFRGRRIAAPAGDTTRPTTDMVREAIFNSLRAMDVLDGAVVLDLFAGTGALGLEALSRGAARCTFVERDGRALRTLRENIATLGVSDRAAVVPADVTTIAASLGSVDIVFADPPYDFDGWLELFACLDANLVVAETARQMDSPDGWGLVRSRAYGRTVVSVFARADELP